MRGLIPRVLDDVFVVLSTMQDGGEASDYRSVWWSCFRGGFLLSTLTT